MQAGSDLGAIIFPQAAVETDTEFSVDPCPLVVDLGLNCGNYQKRSVDQQSGGRIRSLYGRLSVHSLRSGHRDQTIGL